MHSSLFHCQATNENNQITGNRLLIQLIIIVLVLIKRTTVILQGLSSEYLLITPDRSLVFTAMDHFMSNVRKVAVKMPADAAIVIDLSYVSAADFTTAYVSL